MPKPFITQIMGILNITPDSYSDGGLYIDPGQACARIRELLAQGSDIIDIGAQASGPKSKMISALEELDRLKYLLENPEALDLLKDINFSVDTYNADVAEYALGKGAGTINDISGLRFDSRMPDLIAKTGANIVIMHSKESDRNPHATVQTSNEFDSFKSICNFFEKQIAFALSRGIKKKQIILDPGMGMYLSSDPQVSLEITKSASKLKSHFNSFRILYGVSRKSFISKVFGDKSLETASKDLEINLIDQGVDIIRTHNPGLLIELYCKKHARTANE